MKYLLTLQVRDFRLIFVTKQTFTETVGNRSCKEIKILLQLKEAVRISSQGIPHRPLKLIKFHSSGVKKL